MAGDSSHGRAELGILDQCLSEGRPTSSQQPEATASQSVQPSELCERPAASRGSNQTIHAPGGIQQCSFAEALPSEDRRLESKLLHSQREFFRLRNILRQAREVAVTMQYDLQQQHDTSHHCHRFYHEHALGYQQEALGEDRSGLAQVIQKQLTQLQQDHNSLLAQDQVVQMLESDLAAQLRYLQRLEAKEEEALNSLLVAAGLETGMATEGRSSLSDPDTAMPYKPSGSVVSTDDTDPLLRDYFSRTGDVRYLRERLADGMAHYTEELEKRQMLVDQGQTLAVSDEEFERSQLDEIQDVQEQLKAAIDAEEQSRAKCFAAGITVPQQDDPYSLAEHATGILDFTVDTQYETLSPPNSVPPYLAIRGERASSADDTGSHSLVHSRSFEAAQNTKKVGEWMQNVEVSSVADVPFSGSPIVSTPTAEEQPVMPSVNPTSDSQGLKGAPDRRENEEEKASPTLAQVPAKTGTHEQDNNLPAVAEGSDSMRSQLVHDVKIPRQDSGTDLEASSPLKRSKRQIPCLFTRTFLALARRQKPSTCDSMQHRKT